jgi:hypothetical protein
MIGNVLNTTIAETPLVILIKKKHHETKKKKKNCARLYPALAALTYLLFRNSGDVVGLDPKITVPLSEKRDSE